MTETVRDALEANLDTMARVMALEAIVTRLLASNAQRDPGGVGARMIADIDGVVDSIGDGLPDGSKGLSALIEPYLRHYVQRASDLRDAAGR